MYVFTVNGHFDNLLDMNFEDAERYAMRRMSASGDKPSYRTARGIAPEYHTVDYGTRRDYDTSRFDRATLQIVTPVTSLEGEKAWEEGEERDAFPLWEKFIEEAGREGLDENGGDYYQWPWPIP